ncbi:hypothetical protein NDU88_004460 [Pleurodeles waltl]|uniref:Uncharacterized protein n=1 Tax=Pleurodeles waltl TaxID=8319 RepID=A0AAV7KZI7_PLEWA|nr:hypothetical protein NDU88_004460 [Pleurodeles waltl]
MWRWFRCYREEGQRRRAVALGPYCRVVEVKWYQLQSRSFCSGSTCFGLQTYHITVYLNESINSRVPKVTILQCPLLVLVSRGSRARIKKMREMTPDKEKGLKKEFGERSPTSKILRSAHAGEGTSISAPVRGAARNWPLLSHECVSV